MILVFFRMSSSLYKYLVNGKISSRMDARDPDEIECNEIKLKYTLDSHNTLHGIGTNISNMQ